MLVLSHKKILPEKMTSSYMTCFYVAPETTVILKECERLYGVEKILHNSRNLLPGYHIAIDDNTKNPIIMLEDINLFSDNNHKIVSLIM